MSHISTLARDAIQPDNFFLVSKLTRDREDRENKDADERKAAEEAVKICMETIQRIDTDPARRAAKVVNEEVAKVKIRQEARDNAKAIQYKPYENEPLSTTGLPEHLWHKSNRELFDLYYDHIDAAQNGETEPTTSLVVTIDPSSTVLGVTEELKGKFFDYSTLAETWSSPRIMCVMLKSRSSTTLGKV